MRGKAMEDAVKNVSVKQIQKWIEMIAPCMDDYLYLYDIKGDSYFISPSASERFGLPRGEIHHVEAALKQVTFPEDYPILAEDMEQILLHGKKFHNLQYRWVGKDGKPIWINCRGRVTCDEDGTPLFLIGCINEIGMMQKADNVSGLLRESGLQKELEALPEKQQGGFMLRLGIDNFKEINENKGMEYGDSILRKVAECITSVLKDGQKLFRVVADEYMIVDLYDRDASKAVKLYHKIQEGLRKFLEQEGYEVFFTISAGILEFSQIQGKDYHNLMKLSEFALSQAKSTGKNRYYLYQRKDYEAFLHKKVLSSLMLWSVNHDFAGFETYFQPIVDMKAGKLLSAETLLRFRTEDGTMISPVEFIPLLEESGLIIPVGKWVLNQAMAACKKCREFIPEFRVNVNISYIQVLKSNVLEEIVKGLDRHKLGADGIVIELTESGFLESNAYLIRFCNGLKERGIPLALDDFGTGYSNFHYLYNLNLNTIKIDRSFTMLALQNTFEHNLLQHMSDMVHDSDIKLCVEGIETKEELQKICKVQPDYIQGYYFGKPVPFESFLELLKNFDQKILP